MIDTLNISERYLKAKSEEKKAKLIAHLFHEAQEEHLKKVATKDDIKNLATKEDISKLEGDIKEVKGEMRGIYHCFWALGILILLCTGVIGYLIQLKIGV